MKLLDVVGVLSFKCINTFELQIQKVCSRIILIKNLLSKLGSLWLSV